MPATPTGEIRQARTREIPLRDGQTREREKDVRETITLNGAALHCLVVTVEGRRGAERRWITNEVPCTGVVRSEVNGSIVSEVLEWGTDSK